MAKIAARSADLTLNSVSMEELLDEISLKVSQETPEVTCLADAGPRRVVGNYDFSMSVKGAADFASGASDATLAGLIGSSGVTAGYDPTGASADSNNPNYDSTVVLGSYEITSKTGQATMLSAELRGNSALTRAVA